MKRAVLTVAVVALASSMASAQQFITIGPHTSNYTGFSRGFSYTAPIDHTIVRLELPLQNWATGALASYAIGVNGAQVLYSMGNAGAISGFSHDIFIGDEVIILGNWTTATPPTNFSARNSYASGAPDLQSILGEDVLLYRAGFQYDIAAGTLYFGGAGSAFSGLSGSYGRIWVTVIPAPASLALLGLGGLVAFRRRR